VTTTTAERSAAAPVTITISETRGRLLASLVGVLIGAVPFLMTLWDYGFRPLRSALPSRLFSNFYDIQADAFLDGDLAVPTGSLGIEGFRHDGHEYTYFGPLPAVLRLPIAAFDDSLHGRLTAPSMLLAWVVAAVFVSLSVWRVRAMVTPGQDTRRGELIAGAGFIAVVLGGSPLLLLAATPWVYSEALMWAFTFTVGALYALVGVLQQPTWRRILATALLTLGAVLTRATAGWGCGLAVIAVGILFAVSPARRAHRRTAPWIIAAGIVPLTIGMAINVAKFGHPVMIPFDDQVWTAESLARQAVLADGGVVGARFLPTTLYNYLRPDGIRLSPVFPFLSPPAEPAQPVGDVLLDMRYRTPSATAYMPLLCVVALIGLVVIARRGASVGRASLRVPVLGALSITGGMLLVGYVAPRYLVELLPALTIAGAAGLFAVLARIGHWRQRRRVVVAVTATLLAGFGASANAATALTSARVAAGGSSLRDYVELQRWVSDHTGDALQRYVGTGATLPARSAADQLFVVGECGALLVGTGDLYEPWIPLDIAPMRVTVRLGRRSAPANVDVVRFDGGDEVAVTIEYDNNRRSYRVVTSGTRGGYTKSVWRRIVPGTAIDIEVRPLIDEERYIIDIPGYVFTETPLVRHLRDPRSQVVLPRAVVPSPRRRSPLDISVQPPTPSPLCDALVEGA
jgi:hypothetical protein